VPDQAADQALPSCELLASLPKHEPLEQIEALPALILERPDGMRPA